MKMPMGRFKGQEADSMTTQYLVWLVTRDDIRFKQWPLIKEVLRILRSRFNDWEKLLTELQATTPPPARRPTPESIAQRKAEKAEKLRQLEENRAVQRRERREIAKAQRAMQKAAGFLRVRVSEPPPGIMLDAHYFVRQARTKTQTPPEDGSDLV